MGSKETEASRPNGSNTRLVVSILGFQTRLNEKLFGITGMKNKKPVGSLGDLSSTLNSS